MPRGSDSPRTPPFRLDAVPLRTLGEAVIAVSVDRPSRDESAEHATNVANAIRLAARNFRSLMLSFDLGIEWTNLTTKVAICCRRERSAARCYGSGEMVVLITPACRLRAAMV